MLKKILGCVGVIAITGSAATAVSSCSSSKANNKETAKSAVKKIKNKVLNLPKVSADLSNEDTINEFKSELIVINGKYKLTMAELANIRLSYQKTNKRLNNLTYSEVDLTVYLNGTSAVAQLFARLIPSSQEVAESITNRSITLQYGDYDPLDLNLNANNKPLINNLFQALAQANPKIYNNIRNISAWADTILKVDPTGNNPNRTKLVINNGDDKPVTIVIVVEVQRETSQDLINRITNVNVELSGSFPSTDDPGVQLLITTVLETNNGLTKLEAKALSYNVVNLKAGRNKVIMTVEINQTPSASKPIYVIEPS